MGARQALEAQAAEPVVPAAPRFEEPAGPAPEDPIQTDRKRREYESLFASKSFSAEGRKQSDRTPAASLEVRQWKCRATT
jgi:hypothetical protein